MKKIEEVKERMVKILMNSEILKDYYKNSKNVTELKLKIMDNKELSSNESITEYLKLDEELIKDDLDTLNIGIERTGALIKHHQEKSENLSYRIIESGQSWTQTGEWINFFFKLGRFIQQEKEINFFVNYLDRIIPSTFIAMGIIDEYYFEKNKSELENISEDFIVGDEISYLFSDKNWYKAKVIEINQLNDMQERFNPYLKINVTYKNELITVQVPRTFWAKKIRKGGIVTGGSGKSDKVLINDRISEVIASRHSKELVNNLKMYSQINVNLIGWGIDKKIRDVRNKIQFRDKNGSFFITDYLYLNNDIESNYANIYMVSSDKTEINQDSKSVSIFVGAKNALNLSKYKSKRNIYLTSRIRKEYYEDTRLLINNLTQNSEISKEKRVEKLDELYDYLQQFNIDIPKGVEVYVF